MIGVGAGGGAGGGVNGGGGGGGGVEPEFWLGSDGFVGSFMDNLRRRGHIVRQARNRQGNRGGSHYAANGFTSSETSTANVQHRTPMKNLINPLVAIASVIAIVAAPGNLSARSMLDIPGLPASALQVYMPHEAYSKLVNAPIKAYILVRGQVANNKVSGARVAHSEANGVYDKIAMQMATGMTVYSDMSTTRLHTNVLVHVLIYGLPDNSEDALAIAQNDAVGSANLIYSRSLMMRHLGLANQAPKKKK